MDGLFQLSPTISTNANSKPNNLICSWERSRELGILGTRYFKFKVDTTGEKEFNENSVDIEWTVEIFYICSNFVSKCENNFTSGYENQENKCNFTPQQKVSNIQNNYINQKSPNYSQVSYVNYK